MPITFRRSFRLLPWVRLNISRRTWSITLGPPGGPHYTINSRGTRTTSLDLPGGLSYRDTNTRSRKGK